MGHIIVLLLAAVIVGVLLTALATNGGRRVRRGTLPGGAPVARDQPSADAPTPAASVVADPAQREAARRHTPPA